MSAHQATPEQWGSLYEYAFHCDAQSSCLLELRSRIELLEKRCEVQLTQLSDVQERSHRLALQVRQLENELVRDDAPTSTSLPSKETAPLLERVAAVISRDGEPINWVDAYAVIREVASWIQDKGGAFSGTWAALLELETKL
jgi:hypothetical protein